MVKIGEGKKLSPEILHKIKQITLFTNRVVRKQLLGQTRSTAKGMGFDFESLREYAIGDDVRFIDWRASCRSDSMLVRDFRQDQTKTVMIVVDVSRSLAFGTTEQKKEKIAQLAAAIALVGHTTQDLVGLILFSDTVELYLPPKRDRGYINVIMHALFSWEPKGKSTMSKVVQDHLLKAILRQSLLFWFSDCIDDEFASFIKKLTRTHDVYVMRCLDKLEQYWPAVGSLLVEDIETGNRMYINMNSDCSLMLKSRMDAQETVIKQSGARTVDIVDVPTAIEKIVALFRARTRV